MISILFDDEAVQRSMSRLSLSLQTWKPEMHDAAKIIAARLNRNFLDSRSLFTALAPSTIRGYESKAKRTGERLVSPFDPLRGFKDSLRIPATVTDPGVQGSSYSIDRSSMTVGIDPDKIVYARRALLGYKDLTPARDAMTIWDADVEAIGMVFEYGLNRRLTKAGA